MDKSKHKDDTHDELFSLSWSISSVCSEDYSEVTSSKLICSEPKDVTEKLEDEKETKDHSNKSTGKSKRRRSMEHRVMMEKKRRKNIRDKVDMLLDLIPCCKKTDFITKLDNIIEYIKSLEHKKDMMYMAYTEPLCYMSPFYGPQAPYMLPYVTPWGYYAPGIQMMPHQNMPFIAQFPQVPFTAKPDQTQPKI